MIEQMVEKRIITHFDQTEICPGYSLVINKRHDDDGVSIDHGRKVYVTVAGDLAGSMFFSMNEEDRERRAFCYGQRDQINGFADDAGEARGAMLIASRYRKGAGR